MMLHGNRLRSCLLAFALFGMAVAGSPAVHAATVIVVNNDGAGEGFNDPTAAAPVGGNSGTTVGMQRQIAFQRAADIWGALLSSAVPIRVGARFNPLSCTATSAILGSAGPVSAYRDFAGAPVAGTWYPVALANALYGSDLDSGAGNDISAQFNSNIGTTGCMESSGWYYGLDASPPSGKMDFVSVLLHELGHGLGFLTYVNLTTGARMLGFNDTYMRNLESHGAVPSDYPSMSDAQRVTASTSTGNLHWLGANVRAASGMLTAGTVGDHVRMYAPSPAKSGSSVSHWDTVLTPNQIMEPSYTVALHNPVLELPLFKDIGWTVLAMPLTVTRSGAGPGTVTSAPAGINCGATCSASFTSGTSVTLTALPGAGSSFAGWSGACTGTGTCTVIMNNPKSVTATFTLADDGFPSGGTLPPGWIQPAGSNAPWVVATDTAYGGSSSLKSGVILDGQKSDLSYTANFIAGTVSFARRVSSELSWDFLEFYIDGVKQNSWSGEVPWSVVNFPITAGTHTLLWRYIKDAQCCIGGSDAAWIDSAALTLAVPPGAPAGVAAIPGPGSVTISFTVPASNGGSPITSYTATCTATGQTTRTASGTNSPIIVRQLTGRVVYSCSVVASNSAGPGASSALVSAEILPGSSIVPILMLLFD